MEEAETEEYFYGEVGEEDYEELEDYEDEILINQAEASPAEKRPAPSSTHQETMKRLRMMRSRTDAGTSRLPHPPPPRP